jgi:ribosomal protein S12 methylthiotransferase accessory factor
MRLLDDKPSRKAYTLGTHRVRSPADTFDAIRRWMPRLGITRVANITGLDIIGIPVFTAIRPNSRTLSTSQGKGLDVDAARTSALMEAIELWHAEHLALPLRRASYAELAQDAHVLDPTSLPLRRGAAFVPASRRLWAEAHDISRDQPVWVPHDMLACDEIDAFGGSTFMQDSNGLASGNALPEAVVHGLCEVIERDAEALWRASSDMRRLDLTTVAEPYVVEIIERIERAGVVVAVWDITSDVGIPAYACGLIDPPGSSRWCVTGFFHGFGCHLSPAVALSRALTEAVQVRLTYIAGSRDDLFRDAYRDVFDPGDQLELWREMTSEPPSVRASERQDLTTDTFEGDLRVLVDALARVGVDRVVMADLTRGDIGVAVVKVIVPGLEGSFPSAQPGARAIAAMARSVA